MVPFLESAGWTLKDHVESDGWSGACFAEDRLLVTFANEVRVEQGNASAQWCAKWLAQRPCEVVFDTRALEGYPSQMRAAWQEHVWSQRHQILRVALVSTHSLHRMGVAMFGLALSVPTSTSTSPEGYLQTTQAHPLT